MGCLGELIRLATRVVGVFGWVFVVSAVGGIANEAADRGYRFLVDQPLIPPDFDQETLETVWQVWPEPLRERAAAASDEERRKMIFDRYGLTPRPDDPTKPLQYVVDAAGQWTMNCFACHGGEIAGRVVPGAPNREYDLQTLTEETRKNKLRLGKPMTRMDLGSLFIPLGSTRGTTNAVIFGIALMHFRDAELNVLSKSPPPPQRHHDMDAPPWWHFKERSHLYIDGFAERSHRGLMQFALVKENGPEWFRANERPFEDVYAFLMSVESPKYPGPIDARLAARGATVFKEHCERCHGDGTAEGYPLQAVAIDEVGTDRVRFDALTVAHREGYGASWFGDYGHQETRSAPIGYVAPPLTGVWASAPYLHNGSVPTLESLLHPDRRPQVWRRTSGEYDLQRVGVAFEQVSSVPLEVADFSERRRYFDTRRPGKSAAGHDYPSEVAHEDRPALLEFLKTL